MSCTAVEGAHYQSPQKKVYLVTTSVTIPEDADQVNTSTGSLTLTLPLDARPGKTIKVCANGVTTTVAANTGQSLSNGAVASGVSRDFTVFEDVAGTLVWVPQALA